MRTLGAKLGLWRLVWLHDSDGDINLRIMRRGGPTGLKAIRVGPWFCPVRMVYLQPDGEVLNGLYVKRWTYAEKGCS